MQGFGGDPFIRIGRQGGVIIDIPAGQLPDAGLFRRVVHQRLQRGGELGIGRQHVIAHKRVDAGGEFCLLLQAEAIRA